MRQDYSFPKPIFQQLSSRQRQHLKTKKDETSEIASKRLPNSRQELPTAKDP
jgi:hypothetical protein